MSMQGSLQEAWRDVNFEKQNLRQSPLAQAGKPLLEE